MRLLDSTSSAMRKSDKMSDGDFRNPDEETRSRWQGEKETLGASSNHEPPPWKDGDQLNDFILEKLLGSGSSGFIYRVLDVKTKRRCALKLLKHGAPDDLLRNKLGFRRMMSIEHPHLLRVDRIYQLGSYIALSMEEVDGITLSRAVKQFKELDPDLAYSNLLKLLRDFASGLAMMHAHGYIHRDVKPDNLMVDHNGNGRVIDYGLVDSFELDRESFSSRGFLLGTPHYFSPEVIWSQRYLPASDIFSLGIVILDALRTLQRSAGKERLGVQRSDTSRHDDAEGIQEAIAELSDSVPGIIREACREMLDRDPAERPTAMGLARRGLKESASVSWPQEELIIGRQREKDEIFSWVDEIFGGAVGRLHITGPSGIGKTRLVEEIVKQIESKNWGQVFVARCRSREDQPLQAFDQLCDAITNRYMKGDREPLELDPVSAEILESIFPVLKSVMTCCMQLAPAGTTTERLDALEAAARMSAQLRIVGPLFLVIDDSQWADRDSLNAIDRLQSAFGEEGLGIVTVSRDVDDPQRVPASKYVQLQPLSETESIEILKRAASRWAVDAGESDLRALAKASGGSPFRLTELADELRAGRSLANVDAADFSLTELGQIDRLWQRRAERLSDDATLVLPFVVTAGGRVSTEQLGELTGLGDSVDAAVSELARQRLITDEATGGQCITIFHDHVADELIKTLSNEVRRKAHHAWASLLVRQDDPQSLAARIAGHFFAAGEPGRAVAHAILAAEDAERRAATTEAARWYVRVIEHLEGKEKVIQVRNAARCFHEADYPADAAECYQQLAGLVGSEERIECQLLATSLFIRSGRFAMVRDQLHELARTLHLPRPKPPLWSRVALTANGMRLALQAKLASGANNETRGVLIKRVQEDRYQQQRLRLCISLARPLSMFDNLYAAELNVAGAMLALKHGDEVARIHSQVGEAVFGCYDRGIRRKRSEAMLAKLQPQVAKLNHSRATGDLWSGIAFSHALACRWEQVPQPVQTSIQHFEAVTDSNRFELAHTQWLDLWANWHLGRWDVLTLLSDSMFDDATRRSDLFQQLVTTGGFGGAAWLVRDKMEDSMRIRAKHAEYFCEQKSTQMFHVFDWITSMQSLLYAGDYAEAWSEFRWMQPKLRHMPYSRMQLIRVVGRSLGALTALHNLYVHESDQWASRIRILTHQLRQEQIGYARVLANLYEGLLIYRIAGKSQPMLDQAAGLLQEARDEGFRDRLRPYQLAAEDALASIHTGESLGLLRDRMKHQNVVRPSHLERLYTVITD